MTPLAETPKTASDRAIRCTVYDADAAPKTLDDLDAISDVIAQRAHLASQSHRQKEVSKQLTIIATIFLPPTYITGFFGQNFGWMVNNIVSPQIFWGLGVGSQAVTVIILFAYFRYKKWF